MNNDEVILPFDEYGKNNFKFNVSLCVGLILCGPVHQLAVSNKLRMVTYKSGLDQEL